MMPVPATNLLLLVTAVLVGWTAAQDRTWLGGKRAKPSDRNGLTPIFKDTNKNITASPGQRAVLKCRVEHLGTRTVTWRREDEDHPLTIGLFPFVSDSRITVDFNQRNSEWSLMIQDIKPDDEGVYHCQISTKHADHKLSYDVRLNVETVQISGPEFIERGAPIRLNCNATGKPLPPDDIEWLKDGVVLESNVKNGIIVTKMIAAKVLVSVLVVQVSKPSDEGEYTCRSTNHDSASMNVHILSVQAPVGKRGTSSASTGRGRVRSSASTLKPFFISSIRWSPHSFVSVSVALCFSLTSAFVVRWL